MNKKESFGINLGNQIRDAYNKKYRVEICLICRKRSYIFKVYTLNKYLLENRKSIKDNKISLLRKIDGKKVCKECYDKLMELERFYGNVLINKCTTVKGLAKLSQEYRDKVEWYWS